ncbi:MAG: IS3 family transposase [Gammaproteobacteria bacterium]|nr:IS3 family transposase [Gammaproteobacteria bacterium]
MSAVYRRIPWYLRGRVNGQTLGSIAPSTYYEHTAREGDPQRLPQRTQRDARLAPEVQRVWTQNHAVYGVGKVCHPLKPEGHSVARCTTSGLMRSLGLRG